MPRFSNDEAEYVRTPPSIYSPLLNTAIPAGTAVQVMAPELATDAVDGGLVVNTGTVALYYSPYGVATVNDIPLAPNQSVTLPVPSTFGLSVFCPAGGAAGAVRGYSY